jgi:hypothetical protein
LYLGLSPPCPNGAIINKRSKDTSEYLKEGYCSYSNNGFNYDISFRKTGLTEVEYDTLHTEGLTDEIEDKIPTFKDTFLKANNISVY